MIRSSAQGGPNPQERWLLLSRKALRLASVIAVTAFSGGSLGCWEQVSDAWFPQMKRQRAVQAFEGDTQYGAGQPFAPPEGTVPVGNPYPNVGGMEIMAQEALPNPVPASLESLEGGEVLFRRYCTTCHGPEATAMVRWPDSRLARGRLAWSFRLAAISASPTHLAMDISTPPSPWAAGECRATNAFLPTGDGI